MNIINTEENTKMWEQPKRVEDHKDRECLHDGCQECNGTGRKKMDGTMCIHALSCPCPRCSPFCMSVTL